MPDSTNARTIWQAMTDNGIDKKGGEIPLKAMEIRQRFMRAIA